MKKIAVNTMKTFLKEHKREDTYTQTFKVADSSFEVVFHTNLSIAEKSTFINRVLKGCFDHMGNFRPEYVSPVLRATILQMCTNVPALTLKNEMSDNGSPALDLEAMNDLYVAMDLDCVNNPAYQAMMSEMVQLSMQAIDWKKARNLSSHNTDSALRNLLDTLTAKVDGMDTSSLMQYAGILSEATKGLGEGDILKGLLEARAAETAS
ncbi:hypothetical protein AALB19_00855 [Oscillospiraceae bacterium 50-58]|jgi:hypothetical protein|nr:hypothetical protein [Oscillospiraceae bacterium]